MYLLWAVTEYVLATKDASFLQELVHYYPSPSASPSTRPSTAEQVTVLSSLEHALNFSVTVVGTGTHGLLRLLSSDWDDGFHAPKSAYNKSESVLTSALAAYALPR
jgi:cellobiose phosphorylase